MDSWNRTKILILSLPILLTGCGTSDDISPWALRALQLDPSRAIIQPGGHQKFIATVKDAAGNEVSDVSFEWALSDNNIAEIEVDTENNNTAFVTGNANGTVEVRVTSSGASVASALTISASSSRPVEVSRVFPEEGSAISEPRPEIVVEVSYRRCICGDDALDTVRLLLDGTEVTEQATWSGTLDIPQTSVEIVFLPPLPLSSGTHTVEARLTSRLERSSTYSWFFRIE